MDAAPLGAFRGPIVDPSVREFTGVFSFDGGGGLDDPQTHATSVFGTDAQVAHAPELDDLHEADDLKPMRLTPPASDASQEVWSCLADVEAEASFTATSDVRGVDRRRQRASAARSRLLVAAVALGAAAAAAQSVITVADEQINPAVLAAGVSALADGTTEPGVQVVPVAPAATDAVVHDQQWRNAASFADARAQREARMARPLYVVPAQGITTSGFGMRWGVLHGGVDAANAIGTPVLAVSDGVVIASGPVEGYGIWVKVLHSDATVTLYGHLNSTAVAVGDRVMAGDQIATMGNTGNSTGPHLHLEVLRDGAERIDPAAWLAQRGVVFGA